MADLRYMKLPTFEEAHATVRKLAENFEANKGHFLSPAYQESEVRTDFINKFLIALGWVLLCAAWSYVPQQGRHPWGKAGGLGCDEVLPAHH